MPHINLNLILKLTPASDFKGLSAGLLLLGNGDILGCSGIVSSIVVKPKETFSTSEGKWKVLFVSVFLITSRFIAKFGESRESLQLERQIVAQSSTLPIVSSLGFAVAGFLVGFGTRLGNGCTTGHGICGMARLSKRSLVAVATFMTTGLFSASMCSPMCKFATYLRTTVAGINAYFPTEQSTFYSTILLATLAGMTVPLFLASSSKSGKQSVSEKNNKGPVAAVSAMVFSAGLYISGMTKNYKIYNFLDLKLLEKGGWDPTLMFVMGSGLLVSAISYHFVKGHNIVKVRFITYNIKV